MAYSDATGTEYPDWDALVAAEANGYAVVGVSTRPNTHPVVVGPFPDQATARRAGARLRRKWKRQEAELGARSFTFVRVLWKEENL